MTDYIAVLNRHFRDFIVPDSCALPAQTLKGRTECWNRCKRSMMYLQKPELVDCRRYLYCDNGLNNLISSASITTSRETNIPQDVWSRIRFGVAKVDDERNIGVVERHTTKLYNCRDPLPHLIRQSKQRVGHLFFKGIL